MKALFTCKNNGCTPVSFPVTSNTDIVMSQQAPPYAFCPICHHLGDCYSMWPCTHGNLAVSGLDVSNWKKKKQGQCVLEQQHCSCKKTLAVAKGALTLYTALSRIKRF